MDRTLDVRTPESIAFSYELAGVGSRGLAVVVDLIVQIAILSALFLGLGLLAPRLPRVAVLSAAELQLARSIGIGIVIAIVFAVSFGYFIVLEAVWGGQTPGKKMFGIRVVRDGGYPLDFGSSLVRNIIRVGELFLGFYALGAICAIVSPENKRLGDYAAGTIVVRDARALPAAQFIQSFAEQRPAAHALGEDDRALVSGFLARRATLSPSVRRSLASQIAAHVRPKAPAEVQALDDEQMLERL